MSTAASGQTATSKREQARQITAKLAALNEQAETLTEQYNDAKLALAEANKSVKKAQAKAAATHRELARRQRELSRHAIAAYMTGNSSSELSLFLGAENSSEAGRRHGYVDAALGNGEELIERLRTARADADGDRLAVTTIRDRAATEAKKLNAKQDATKAAVAEQTKLLTQVNGELGTLVRQEQARRASTEMGRTPVFSGPTPPASGSAALAIQAARRMIGVRYKWAGASPSTGFDCSGFTMWAWAQGGKSLPHSSRSQYSMSQKISLANAVPGDLVFYGSPVHHVALYIGNGQIIHAPSTGEFVRIDSVNYWSALAGVGRI